MARRLLLDSTILIADQRERLRLRDILSSDDDVAISDITVAELRVGELFAQGSHRTKMELYRQELFDIAARIPYTESTALVHAELLHFSRSTGKTRGAHDLIIAATAKETDRILVTTDARANFSELPGVKVLVVAVGRDSFGD